MESCDYIEYAIRLQNGKLYQQPASGQTSAAIFSTISEAEQHIRYIQLLASQRYNVTDYQPPELVRRYVIHTAWEPAPEVPAHAPAA